MAETANTAKDRCKHPGCNCSTSKGDKYCSPHCETVKTGRRKLPRVRTSTVQRKISTRIYAGLSVLSRLRAFVFRKVDSRYS